jgi:hypothetical protein
VRYFDRFGPISRLESSILACQENQKLIPPRACRSFIYQAVAGIQSETERSIRIQVPLWTKGREERSIRIFSHVHEVRFYLDNYFVCPCLCLACAKRACDKPRLTPSSPLHSNPIWGNRQKAIKQLLIHDIQLTAMSLDTDVRSDLHARLQQPANTSNLDGQLPRQSQ